ncbi:ABC transporter ATP-binding protein [Bacillus sp. EAC]|uniref:ABC transporter ATP-binding protein n=1 Tax=Bacillus sp. EAC TaxID=1978338 RepID=UPI000B448C8C|nr:ABC transporter ATP-binding protein [Bacillus sp. EAC]
MIKVEGLSFWYPDEHHASLSDISFTINEGEFVVLCGASGCGKTTLLKHLKQEIKPIGKTIGNIFVFGEGIETISNKRAAEQIGMVFQNPENQIVMDTVWHELVFSMENMGYSLTVMRKRLAEMANYFGLESLLYKSVHELSGGQKQLLNLASVLLLQPKLLLLDEPTSQLDPIAAKEFLQILRQINQDFSTTVILSEHRLEDVIPMADRVFMLEKGKIKYVGSPQYFCNEIGNGLNKSDLSYLPAVTRLYLNGECVKPKEGEIKLPLTVREGKSWFTKSFELNDEEYQNHKVVDSKSNLDSEMILECKEVTFSYGKNEEDVLKKLTLSIYKNEFLAIVGGNGAGKTTLLQVLAGLLSPQRGKVKTSKSKKIGYLAQNPLIYFSYDTVEEEILLMANQAGLIEPEKEIKNLLILLEIEDIIKMHPHDLSGGQQQKVALAMVLISRPDILLIDEPTKGLDPIAKLRLAELLQDIRNTGTTIVMVTHDVEFAARHTSRCALLFDGYITTNDVPSNFFSENYFYTTSINRLVRDRLPNALTEEDVIRKWVVRDYSF